jgi:hypothetical protein
MSTAILQRLTMIASFYGRYEGHFAVAQQKFLEYLIKLPDLTFARLWLAPHQAPG